MDFAVNLLQAVGVATQCLSSYQLDGHLDAAVFLPAHLDLAEFALTECLSKDVVTEPRPLRSAAGVVLSAPSCSSSSIVNAFAADEAETGYRCDACARCFCLPRLFAGNIFLRVCHDYPVENSALFSGEICACRWLTDGRRGAAMCRLRRRRPRSAGAPRLAWAFFALAARLRGILGRSGGGRASLAAVAV